MLFALIQFGFCRICLEIVDSQYMCNSAMYPVVTMSAVEARMEKP